MSKPLLSLLAALLLAPTAVAQDFSFEQLKSYPFPTQLTASASGSRIAWAMNEQGRRNIWVAEGPSFTARRLTNYTEDDGQELTSVSLSADGEWVVYLRGGDHGSNWDDEVAVNPTFDPDPPSVQIHSIAFDGGEPNVLATGAAPVISPRSDLVAFNRGGQIWTLPIDGSGRPAVLFRARGSNGGVEWSPDGSRLAFVSNRGDHSLVGIYTNADTPIKWVEPSFTRDGSPRWSPDGTKIAFVRTGGGGGAPDSILVSQPRPWSIWSADASTGKAIPLWDSPRSLRGSVPSTEGGTNLHWGAGRIVFLSYQDGWPHLYSIPEAGGASTLLTPGRFMAEYISMSPNGEWMVFAGNTGPDPLDIDRRHVVKVAVNRQGVEVMTPGTGNEWTPVVTGDGNTLAFIGATAQEPPVVTVMPLDGGPRRALTRDRIPTDFPTDKLVTPKQVIFDAPDGTRIHGQLFERADGPAKKPAIIYVHGGPPRQMLLGWHYSDYYANAYATNQYLASRGFVVLSVNYRLGIGYGYEFHRPARGAGRAGASEYQDVKAGAEWLARQPQVDAAHIGIYGGSYGGYLTALALGRDSKLFAAGVDIHGVHDWTARGGGGGQTRYEQPPDLDLARRVAWESSPVSAIDTWTSPVLVIHADDDRNVQFSQSTDLVQRLHAKGVDVETLVIVDDTHHMMRHTNWITIGKTAAAFFERRFMGKY